MEYYEVLSVETTSTLKKYEFEGLAKYMVSQGEMWATLAHVVAVSG